jgi:hypothetical protein
VTCCCTYHTCFAPQRLADKSQIFFRGAHVLSKWPIIWRILQSWQISRMPSDSRLLRCERLKFFSRLLRHPRKKWEVLILFYPKHIIIIIIHLARSSVTRKKHKPKHHTRLKSDTKNNKMYSYFTVLTNNTP